MSQHGLLPFTVKIGDEEKESLRYLVVYAFWQAGKEGKTTLQIAPSVPQEAYLPERVFHTVDLPLSFVFSKARCAWASGHALVDLSDGEIAKERAAGKKDALKPA